MLLTALGSGQPGSYAFRILAVVGAIIATALLLDMVGPERNRFLLPLTALLTSLSVILLSRIDAYLAAKQILWVLIGCAALIATYYLVDRVGALADWKYLAGLVAAALMIATIIWGVERNGARLWLNLGGLVSFPPGEIAKPLLVIFLAGYIADQHVRRRTRRPRGREVSSPRAYLVPAALMALLCLGLFVGLRDLGTAVLFLGLFAVMVYLATGSHSPGLVSLLVFVLGVVVVSAVSPHAAPQVQPGSPPGPEVSGGSSPLTPGLFALAEGGLTGAGLGVLPVSAQSLPQAGTNLTFVVLGQDLGLAGVVGVLLLYALLTWTGYRVAGCAEDRFGRLLAAGLTTMFALQTLLVVGGVLKLLPLTAQPLPLMSYGGLPMLVNFIALGLLLSVSRQQAASPAVRAR